MEKKRSKSHENAIYAISHDLKRLKKYHNGVSQVSNFNNYIGLHNEYVQIKSEIDEFLKLNRTNRELREFYCNKNKSTKYGSSSYTFPNLYHYVVIELKNMIEEEYERINKKMILYKVELLGTNKTVSNDGIIYFKSIDDLHYSCHSRYSGDTDFDAYFIYEGAKYHPSNVEDCLKYFKIIEEETEINNS